MIWLLVFVEFYLLFGLFVLSLCWSTDEPKKLSDVLVVFFYPFYFLWFFLKRYLK